MKLPENLDMAPSVVSTSTQSVCEEIASMIGRLGEIRETNNYWAADRLLFIASYALAQANYALAADMDPLDTH